MKISSAVILLPFLAAIPCEVSAHGFVTGVKIDGKSYTGNDPLGATKPSPIRKISTPNPNYGASNQALNCGPNAAPASLVADAMPGSTIQYNWGGYPEWPHNTGPVLTYLGNCGDTTSDKCDTTKLKWFKIHQDGRKSNAEWVQQDIMNGGLVSVTLPKNLAPGNYVIRHEIIALHLAMTKGKAEFYPSCTQIKVGGSGTGVPAANDMVSFPGGYSDSDPGIFTPNVYNTNVAYKFPGPPVVTDLVAGSGSSDAPTSSDSSDSPDASDSDDSSDSTDLEDCSDEDDACDGDDCGGDEADNGSSDADDDADNSSDEDDSDGAAADSNSQAGDASGDATDDDNTDDSDGGNEGDDSSDGDSTDDSTTSPPPAGTGPSGSHTYSRRCPRRLSSDDFEVFAHSAEPAPESAVTNETDIQEETVNRIRAFHARSFRHAHHRSH